METLKRKGIQRFLLGAFVLSVGPGDRRWLNTTYSLVRANGRPPSFRQFGDDIEIAAFCRGALHSRVGHRPEGGCWNSISGLSFLRPLSVCRSRPLWPCWLDCSWLFPPLIETSRGSLLREAKREDPRIWLGKPAILAGQMPNYRAATDPIPSAGFGSLCARRMTKV